MATKQATRGTPDPDNYYPQSEKARQSAREQAQAKARQDREVSVGDMVRIALGRLNHNQRIGCSEVGIGRYRVNLLERRMGTDSEIIEETHIVHSWMVWCPPDSTVIVNSAGDVPLGPLN